MVAAGHVWLLSTGDVASVPQGQTLKFRFILINLRKIHDILREFSSKSLSSRHISTHTSLYQK